MTTQPPVPASVPAFRPLYRQIQDLIVQALADKEWAPGEMIPSEMDLAARFEVSQGTVRRAIDELAAENLLVRRQGKGTFVATHADPGRSSAFFGLYRMRAVCRVRAANHWNARPCVLVKRWRKRYRSPMATQ